MPNRTPPRHVPTLTQVFRQPAPVGAAPVVTAPAPGTRPVSQVVDRNVLAQEVIAQVRPQLEAELRSIALELFEAQFSTLLPSLNLQIEEAVREAIERALPDGADDPV